MEEDCKPSPGIIQHFDTVRVTDRSVHSQGQGTLGGALGTVEPGGAAAAVAAAGGAARPAGNPDGPPLRMFCGAVAIPHVDRAERGSEDAHFVTSAGLGAVGVADGVGSWAEDGVDPAEYSRTLMAHCCKKLESSEGAAAALQVLEYAQEATQVEGSSTACLAVLREGGLLEVLNVGDSGLRVVRGGCLAFQTEAQEHDFNQPYQLAHPDLVTCTDLASDGAQHNVQLQAGDVVVLGSDGLFNNMWESQLLELVRESVHQMQDSFSQEAAQKLAGLLASSAHKNAKKRFFRSPFGVEAASRGLGSVIFRMFPMGGKMDDTTVVVCLLAHR